MKKLLVLLLSALLILGLVACGSNNNDQDDNGTGYENGAAEYENEPEIPQEPDSAVAEFLATYGDELREDLADAMIDGARMEVLAGTGDEIIFEFYFDDVSDEELLIAALDTSGPMFEMMAEVLKGEVQVETLRVTVRFFDGENTLVAEESFDS